MECAAVVNVMEAIGIGEGDDLAEAARLLDRVVAMLTKMITLRYREG